MTEIIVDRQYQEFYLEHGEHTQQITLSLVAAKNLLHASSQVKLYMRVDGWGSPWNVVIDRNGRLRAQCPTCPSVMPIIKYGSVISKSGKTDKECLKDAIMEIELKKK